MVNTMRVMLEIGPKGKRVVAVAPDWPGLSRGAKTENDAVERLRSHLPHYAPVANLAGLGDAFAEIDRVKVVECYPGVGSTDFWGISFGYSEFDRQAMSTDELVRELALMRSSWAHFDDVRSRVSADLAKGPRGGERDQDQIVRHTIFSETDFAKKVNLRPAHETLVTDEGLLAYRRDYCDAILAYHANGKMARTWPLRDLIRYTAFHTLDHTWEMEDKDLTAHLADGDA